MQTGVPSILLTVCVGTASCWCQTCREDLFESESGKCEGSLFLEAKSFLERCISYHGGRGLFLHCTQRFFMGTFKEEDRVVFTGAQSSAKDLEEEDRGLGGMGGGGSVAGTVKPSDE